MRRENERAYLENRAMCDETREGQTGEKERADG
jgi:hypothetical protein